MIHWQDLGFLIKQSLFGEQGYILTILTHQHGKHRGMWRSRKTFLFPAHHAHLCWQGRLPEHLGYFQLDNLYNCAYMMAHHAGAIQLIHLMCLLCDALLPERINATMVYHAFKETLPLLATPDGLIAYSNFEALLFQELGYHLPKESPNAITRLAKRQDFLLSHWPTFTSLYQSRKSFIDQIMAIG
jgi:DNA repair protein RecO (recombination protein O)